MFAAFFIDESGAVTVDWVILTAVLTGLAFAMVAAISIGAQVPTSTMNGMLSSDVVGDNTSFD